MSCYGKALQSVVSLDSMYLQVDDLLSKGDFISADSLIEKGIEAAVSFHDSYWTGKFLNAKGSSNLRQRNLKEALEYYLESLGYLNQQIHPSEYAKVESNLGVIYAQLNEPEKARGYYEHAIGLLVQEDNLMLSISSNLFGLYMQLGEKELAEKTGIRTIELSEKLGNDGVKAILFTNLSNFYLQTNQWDLAIDAGKQSLKIRSEIAIGSPSKTLNNIGYAYYNKQQYSKAEQFLLQALEQAIAEEKVQILWNLQRNYQGMGRWRQSAEILEEYVAVQDSLARASQKEKVLELTEKYESENKAIQIKKLESDNQLQRELISKERILSSGMVIFLLILLGVLFLIIKQFRTQQELEKSKLRQRFLLMQLNPHFLFNALQSVQNYIFKEEKNRAVNYIASFGKLIRSILETSEAETISISKDLDMITHYLSLQQLNYSFDFKIKKEESIDFDAYGIPNMFLQPFIENAVVHGVGQRTRGGEIVIELGLSKDKQYSLFTISDNGPGIKSNHTNRQQGNHQSMAMKILEKRIYEFNRSHRLKINYSITQLSDDLVFPGTVIKFQFPLIYL